MGFHHLGTKLLGHFYHHWVERPNPVHLYLFILVLCGSVLDGRIKPSHQCCLQATTLMGRDDAKCLSNNFFARAEPSAEGEPELLPKAKATLKRLEVDVYIGQGEDETYRHPLVVGKPN